MSDKSIPFVITDRRKFNAEGEPRPDADPSPIKHREPVPEAPPTVTTAAPSKPSAPAPTPISGPVAVPSATPYAGSTKETELAPETEPVGVEGDLPPAPTAEQMEQSRVAFEATADRLDIAIRSANPGMDHPPAMSFEQIVQSVYMQAILQLGGGTQDSQQPQVDLLGARQSIDMLGILSVKAQGNLSPAEQGLIDSAVFELRLAFLEITQALARSAQQRANPGAPGQPGGPTGLGGPGGPGGFGGPGGPKRPSIVR